MAALPHDANAERVDCFGRLWPQPDCFHEARHRFVRGAASCQERAQIEVRVKLVCVQLDGVAQKFNRALGLA